MPAVWKHILSPGTYWFSKKRPPARFTSEDMDRLYHDGKAMLGRGLRIPFPEEHQDGEDALPMSADAAEARRRSNVVTYNRGWISDYRLTPDRKLWAQIDVPDADFARRLETEIRYCSPQISPEFMDKTGTLWSNVITHVAATPMPVDYEQSPFGTPVPEPAQLSAFRQTAAPAALRFSQLLRDGQGPLRLSLDQRLFEGSAMADDNNMMAGNNGNGDSDADNDTSMMGNNMGGGGDDTPDPDVAKCIDEAAELGIVLDPDQVKTPKDFVQHFLTAVQSHKATKALGPDGMAGTADDVGANAGAGGTPQAESPAGTGTTTVMSLTRQLRTVTAERDKARGELADVKEKTLLSTIDHLVANGQVKKERADTWRKEVTAKRLSLTANDGKLDVVLAQVEQASDVPRGTFLDATKRRALLAGGAQAAQPVNPAATRFSATQQDNDDTASDLARRASARNGASPTGTGTSATNGTN